MAGDGRLRGDRADVVLPWSDPRLFSSGISVMLIPFSMLAFSWTMFPWSPLALMVLPVHPRPPPLLLLLLLLLLPAKSGDGISAKPRVGPEPRAGAELDALFFITNLRSSRSILIRSSMPMLAVAPLGLPSFLHIPHAVSPLASTPAPPINPIITPLALNLPFLLPVAFRTTSTIAAVRRMVLA